MTRIVASAQQSKWGSIIAGLGVVFICAATLTPGKAPSIADVGAACRGWCDSGLVADFARNIILFMPMGFGLRLAGVRFSRALLVGMCLSAIVELLQLRIVVGRDASVLDWISNSAGTIGGVALAAHVKELVRPRPHSAKWLAIAALLLVVGIEILGAAGIQPAPSYDAYWGQRTPLLGNAVFAGLLLSARVNGREIPSVRIADDDNIRAALRAGRTSVDAVVRPAAAPISHDLVAIARVADDVGREILMLGREGDDLIFSVRLRATALGLETPSFALEHVFSSNSEADPQSLDSAEALSAAMRDGQVLLTARDQNGSRSHRFLLNPWTVWSFFVPWDYRFGPNSWLLAELCLAALLIPVAYWSAFMERERSTQWLRLSMVVVLGGAISVVPLLFDLPAPRLGTYAAAIAGAVLGWTLSLTTRRRVEEAARSP